MSNLAALIDEKSKDWIDLEASLASLNYRTRLVRSVEELEKLVDRSEFRVVIVDLDLIGVDNRFFRSLKKINPQLNILTVARDPYHPELKEALTHHICACFRKPVDREDIEFWLKAVTTDEHARDPTDRPET